MASPTRAATGAVNRREVRGIAEPKPGRDSGDVERCLIMVDSLVSFTITLAGAARDIADRQFGTCPAADESGESGRRFEPDGLLRKLQARLDDLRVALQNVQQEIGRLRAL